jgi:hypothetical protein
MPQEIRVDLVAVVWLLLVVLLRQHTLHIIMLLMGLLAAQVLLVKEILVPTQVTPMAVEVVVEQVGQAGELVLVVLP